MKSSAVRNLLFQQKVSGFTSLNLLEFVFFSIILPSSGYLIQPRDPFLLQARFPLLLIPPVLLALRYGLAPGMANFVIILTGVTSAYYYGIGEYDGYPAPLLFGAMVLTLITGEMTNASLAKIRHYKAENKLLSLRFGEFTNAFHVMKVSHDQLKEQLANSRFSLREALQSVREKLHEQYRKGRRGLTAEVGSELLSILSYFCSTQITGIYKVGPAGTVEPSPMASQGNLGELRPDDALVCKALEQKSMVSVIPEMDSAKSATELETDLLAVIPIKDISGYLWGIVVVHEMHFNAFQEENLNLMQLICSYAGDILSRAENIFYTKADRKHFFHELESSWYLAKEYGLTSSLICIVFEKDVAAEDIFGAITGRLRSLDHALLGCDENGHPIIFLMMALMSRTEYLEFGKRLDLFLTESLGRSMEALGGVFHHLEIIGDRSFGDYLRFFADFAPALVVPPAEEKALSPESVSDRTSVKKDKTVREITERQSVCEFPLKPNELLNAETSGC